MPGSDGVVMTRDEQHLWSGRRRLRGTEVGRTGARFGPAGLPGPDAREAEVEQDRPEGTGDDQAEVAQHDTGLGRTGARFGPYSARWHEPAELSTTVVLAIGPNQKEIVRADAASGPRDDAHPTGRLPAESDVLIRPYARTGGRTRPGHDLALESLISTTPRGATTAPQHPSREHRAIATLCVQPRSVAEVAALLAIPLGVARVLLSDLATDGTVIVHGTNGHQSPDLALMQRVLAGLHRL
jgi:hypothetical protein